MQMTVLNVPSEIAIVFYYHKFQTSFSFSWTLKMNDILSALTTRRYGLGLALRGHAETLSSHKRADIKQKFQKFWSRILSKVGKFSVLTCSNRLSYFLGKNVCICSSNPWLFWSPTLNSINLLIWWFHPAIPVFVIRITLSTSLSWLNEWLHVFLQSICSGKKNRF